MDKPISVGDLVQVVKPRVCCGDASGLGKVFKVGGFHTGSFCMACGIVAVDVAEIAGDFRSCEISRLKRIPPLEELDDLKRDEEITA